MQLVLNHRQADGKHYEAMVEGSFDALWLRAERKQSKPMPSASHHQ
jgi:hypothetical protein